MAARGVLALLSLLYASVGGSKCDSLCTNNSLILSCRHRILLASSRKFHSKPAACYQAHQWVLEWCPTCQDCALESIGGACTSQQNELRYALDALEEKKQDGKADKGDNVSANNATDMADNSPLGITGGKDSISSSKRMPGDDSKKSHIDIPVPSTVNSSRVNNVSGKRIGAPPSMLRDPDEDANDLRPAGMKHKKHKKPKSGKAASGGNVTANSSTRNSSSAPASNDTDAGSRPNASGSTRRGSGAPASNDTGAGGRPNASGKARAPSPGVPSDSSAHSAAGKNGSSALGGNKTGSDAKSLRCAAKGCVQHYDPTSLCQCNGRCAEFSDCCEDYKATCTVPLRALKDDALGSGSTGSCAYYGCSAKFRPLYTCQCNPECMEYKNCCHDHEYQCHNSKRKLVDKSQARQKTEKAHGQIGDVERVGPVDLAEEPRAGEPAEGVPEPAAPAPRRRPTVWVLPLAGVFAAVGLFLLAVVGVQKIHRDCMRRQPTTVMPVSPILSPSERNADLSANIPLMRMERRPSNASAMSVTGLRMQRRPSHASVMTVNSVYSVDYTEEQIVGSFEDQVKQARARTRSNSRSRPTSRAGSRSPATNSRPGSPATAQTFDLQTR